MYPNSTPLTRSPKLPLTLLCVKGFMSDGKVIGIKIS